MSTGTSDTAPVAPGLRSGLWLPLFGERAEPRAVMQVAAEAEQAGTASSCGTSCPGASR